MALRAIKDFPKATPSTEDLILIEQQGGGRSVSLKELPVSTPVEKKISDVKKDLNDKISALAFEPGDTTGDAELRNIRTPADGFTVPANANAGDAVRAQVTQLDGKISNLKGDLTDLKDVVWEIIPSVNLYNSSLEKVITGATTSTSTTIPFGTHTHNIVLPISGHTDEKISVSRDNAGILFRALTTSDYPANDVTILDIASEIGGKITLVPNANANYYVVQYWVDNSDAKTEEELLAGMKIWYGDWSDGKLKSDAFTYKELDVVYDTFQNKYFRYSDKKFINAPNTEYSVCNPIPLLETEKKITVKADNVNTLISKVTFTDTDTPIVNSANGVVGVWTNTTFGTFDVPVPTGARYVFISTDINGQGISSGGMSARIPVNAIYSRVYENAFAIDSMVKEKASLSVPSAYELVVGDTFELFYHGIVNAFNTDNFEVMIVGDVGNAYSKRFVYTPTSAGTKTIIIKLYDSNHNLLDNKEVSLIAKSVPSGTSTKNVLYIGDSLAVNGTVANEFYRRVAKSDGTPIGNGLANINFIGSQQTTDGARFEAYGGYSFDYYNNETIMYNWCWITTDHDKTEVEDQHSFYKDSNGRIWKLETIESGRIKLIGNTVGQPLPSQSGTLTWYSGGTNHSNIVYSSYEICAGNPFWNSSENKVDFKYYCENVLGESTIDYIYVLLGWNSYTLTDEVYKAQVVTFINNVKASYPNCEIVLLGLQAPSKDGTGHNYTPTNEHTYWYQLQHMFRCNRLYAEIASENTNVSFVNIAGQFDTEHNMQTGTRTVNNRNSETEVFQTNGVHPANSGYLQIADACYRDFIAKLS